MLNKRWGKNAYGRPKNLLTFADSSTNTKKIHSHTKATATITVKVTTSLQYGRSCPTIKFQYK